MAVPLRSRRIAATALKLTLAAGVFLGTIGAWSVAEPMVRARMPLPGADGGAGACTLWVVGSSSVRKWETMQRDMGGWSVHNRGINGAALTEVSARFAHSDLSMPPDAIVFYAGENDIAHDRAADEVAADLLALTRTAHARMPDTRLFVIDMKPSPTRWRYRATQLRVDAIVRTAAANGAPFTIIPAGGALLQDGKPGDFYQPDGIHLSDAGYARWGAIVHAAVDRAISPARVRRCDPRGGNAHA